ncbi:MAG: glycoside hydrolase family 2 protein [Olsenella sp.]
MDLDLHRVAASRPGERTPGEKLAHLTTVWGDALDPDQLREAHPRPQMERRSWQSLDGWWDYAFVEGTDWRDSPLPSRWDGRIVVPFSPESQLSRVERQLEPSQLLWYRRSFEASTPAAGRRVLLHLDGVDFACSVYLNGEKVGEHRGCYLPFVLDISDTLREGENELAVCVWDPSETGTQLRGKQKLASGTMWYTAQSGIWKPVWLEEVPDAHVDQLILDADPDAETLTVRAQASTGGGRLGVSVAGGPTAFGDDTQVTISVPDPRLWEPNDPYLYPLEITYGEDRVRSYCAFRTVAVERDAVGTPRLMLNHRPLFLRGLLDQGYWPDGLLTPPSDEAMAADLSAARDLGFNMVRKHVKVETDRWYYLADRLGMLVWQDIPSGGGRLDPWRSLNLPTLLRHAQAGYDDTTPAHQRAMAADDPAYQEEWCETCAATVTALRNHPSVITWVLFNESWGQFDSAANTQTVWDLDPTRPILSNSGWYDQGAGDVIGVHNYFRHLSVYPNHSDRMFVISEFGGLACHVDNHSSLPHDYGYETYDSTSDFSAAVRNKLAETDALEAQGLAGYVYTQLTDVEEEVNGLLTYDRRVNKMS